MVTAETTLVCPEKNDHFKFSDLATSVFSGTGTITSYHLNWKSSYAGSRQVLLLGLFPQAYFYSIHLIALSILLVLEWWTIIIQLQSKENSVRTLFCQASATCSPIYLSVPSIVALVKLWHLADGMFM